MNEMPNFNDFDRFECFGRAALIKLNHEKEAMKLLADNSLRVDLVGGTVGSPKLCPLEGLVQYIESTYEGIR